MVPQANTAARTSSDISAQEDMIGLEIRYFVYPPPVKIRRRQAKCLPETCPAMLQRPRSGVHTWTGYPINGA